MWFRGLRGESGAFSLAGVVVGIAVLAACALVAAGPLSGGLRDVGGSALATRAAYLALEECERLKGVPWPELGPVSEAEVPGYPGYVRKVLVRDAGPLLKRVEVVVSRAAAGEPGGREEAVLVFERAWLP